MIATDPNPGTVDSFRDSRSPASGVLRDIIGWDMGNWSRALDFWRGHTALPSDGTCLELGCGKQSSLSLWLALLGNRVVCSDSGGVAESIVEAHRRHGVADKVTYADVDARAIPYRSAFDVIVFKSMLGGIEPASLAVARSVISGVYEALKPRGVLLFAENLSSTRLHAFTRRHFAAGKVGWLYFTRLDLEKLTDRFESLELTTFGFAGCFGRSERQRQILARLDAGLLDWAVPQSWHYIGAAIARK
jgi:SAM-dependent methyltransferase